MMQQFLSSFLLPFVSLAVIVHPTLGAADRLTPRCGNCWCTSGSLTSCPTNTTGIADEFPNRFQIYNSFELTNADADYLKLQTPDGAECYPFATTLGAVEDYPASSLPQCAIPESTEDTVCAYLFEPENACEGRKYQALTYESASEAEDAGAVVTHKGACGVCSNAADLWARMNRLNSFDIEVLLCAASYWLNSNLNTRFDTLVECTKEKTGLSSECALIWAHLGAATVSACDDVCQAADLTGIASLNGLPPACEPSPCLACPAQWDDIFFAMQGRTLQGSGITELQARPCSEFTRVIHDPCVGATTGLDGPTNPPTMMPTASGAQTVTTTRSVVVAIMMYQLASSHL